MRKEATRETKYWFQHRILTEDKKGAWFAAANYNGLFYHDFHRKRVSFLGAFPYGKYANALYWSGIKVKNKLYFPPRYADRMAVYDISDGIFTAMDIVPGNRAYQIDFGQNYLGYIPICYGEEVFFLYRCSPFVACMKGARTSFEYILCGETGESLRISADYIISGDYFFSTIADSNRILIFDMKNHELQVKNVGDSEKRFFSIALTEGFGELLLLEEKGVIYTWDFCSDCIHEFLRLPDSICSVHQPLSFYEAGGFLYIIPFYDWFGNLNRCYKIDLMKKHVEHVDIFREYDAYIKFMVYREQDHFGFFIAPYGEDIYNSEHVALLDLHISEGILEKREYIPPGNIENGIFYDKVSEYQRHISCNRLFREVSGKNVLSESHSVRLEDFIVYLEDLDS